MNIQLRQSIEKDFCLSLLDAAIGNHHAEIAEVGAWFDTSWLMDPLYAALATVTFELTRANKPLSNSTLAAALLQAKSKCNQDLRSIWTLLEEHFGWYHLTYYGRQVYNEFRRSAAADDLDESASDLREGSDVTQSLADVSIISEKYQDLAITRTDRADEAINAIIAEMEGVATPRFRLGISELDSITGGFRNGTLTTVAAPTGGGKSVFLAQAAITRVLRDGLDALYFSAEMSLQEMNERWVSFISQSIKDTHDPAQRKAYIGGLSQIRDLTRRTGPLQLFEGVRHVDHIMAATRAYMANHKLGIVCVDYVQMFQGAHPKDNRERQVADITANLKALSMECHIPIFVASQFNRQYQGRPGMQNLKESGSIATDSDVVILLDHDPASKKEQIDLDVIVAKHRSGKRGDCTITWDRPLFTLSGKEPEYAHDFDAYRGDLP